MSGINGFDRQFRIQASFIASNIGYENVNYGSFRGTNVPPHPDDEGAESRPVDGKAQRSLEVTWGPRLTMDFFQWFFIDYQLKLDHTNKRENISQMTHGCRPTSSNLVGSPVCTGKPVPNQTPYSTGDGATFAYVNEGKAAFGSPSMLHTVTVGYYPQINREEKGEGYQEQAFAIKAGLAVKNYTMTNGYVRDGIVEIREKAEQNIFGFAWGLEYRNLFVSDHKKSYNGGVTLSIEGAHFPANTHVLTVGMSIPVGIGVSRNND